MILVLGKNGQLGRELGATLSSLDQLVLWGRKEVNLEKPDELKNALSNLSPSPSLIINAAAWTAVDAAETHTREAFSINAETPGLLAETAKKTGALLVHYSTDYVYDGQKEAAYQEQDQTNPINIYGQSKLAGDEAIMTSGCRHLIFRTSWVFSFFGRNFPKTILKLAEEKDRLDITADQFGTPTSAEFLASATTLAVVESLKHGQNGLYNLVSSGSTNWLEYARWLITRASEIRPLRLKPENLFPRTGPDPDRPAKRPANSRLCPDKFITDFNLSAPHWTYFTQRLLNSLYSS